MFKPGDIVENIFTKEQGRVIALRGKDAYMVFYAGQPDYQKAVWLKPPCRPLARR